jgi:hypothetical protein
MNTDELFAQMMQDELEDAKKLRPIEYAKLRGLYAQHVYRYIRQGKLPVEVCQCGRKVVDIEVADEVFKVGRSRVQGTFEASVQAEEKMARSDLDTREQ